MPPGPFNCGPGPTGLIMSDIGLNSWAIPCEYSTGGEITGGELLNGEFISVTDGTLAPEEVPGSVLIEGSGNL